MYPVKSDIFFEGRYRYCKFLSLEFDSKKRIQIQITLKKEAVIENKLLTEANLDFHNRDGLS